jgi:hypothetical protein
MDRSGPPLEDPARESRAGATHKEGTIKMTRKFKALGLALFAVLATSALAAQGAQAAEEFHGSSAPGVITGELHPQFNTTGGEHTDKFTIEEGGGLTVECDTAKFEGTQATANTPTVTLTPTYGNTTKPTGCKAGGFEATVHTQHCAYVFAAATNAEGHGAVEIECQGATENEILVTVPGLGVTLHIAAQKPKGGVHYTNVETAGHKELTTHSTVKEVGTTCTGGGCFFIGTSFKTRYEGTETIKGFKDVGCTEETGTAKTTPVLAKCEGEQINITKE